VLAETACAGLDLSRGPRRLHLVGAGGAGMSGIATLLVGMGHTVSGSDQGASAAFRRVEALGVRTFVGHDGANLGDAELVAHSTAVPAGNVELEEARRRGVPVVSRAELLAAICAARRTIAVSGTHGKTTVTAMLAAVLEAAGMEPSFLVGGELAGGRGGASWGVGEWFVVEADESDGTFLELPAEAVVVTSVAADHLERFGGLDRLEDAFGRFLAQAPGPRVVCLDDPGAARVAAKLADLPLVSYGSAARAAYRVADVELSRFSARFSLSAAGRGAWRFELAVPGMHNVLDAAAAASVAFELGVEPEVARRALGQFRPVARRFELVGEAGGVSYVDDYAHNAGKLSAAIAAAREGGWGRVVAVFQPHRYSRTAAQWRELGAALAGADLVVVTGVYAAGEAPRPGVDGRLVAKAAQGSRPGLPVYYEGDRDVLARLVRGLLRPGDLCLTLGAGDITNLPRELLNGEHGL
jgi:UDP-N-acetylmuramate--alanine ligase